VLLPKYTIHRVTNGLLGLVVLHNFSLFWQFCETHIPFAKGSPADMLRKAVRAELVRVRHLALHAAHDTLVVAEGVVKGLPALLETYANPLFWVSFLLAAIAGLFLFAIGIALYWGSDTTYDGLSLVEKIINALPGLLNSAIDFFTGSSPIPELSWRKIIGPFYDADKMGDMEDYCAPFTSVLQVFAFVPQSVGNKHFCPPARFLWGTYVHPLYRLLLGALYYNANPNGLNCQIPGSLWVCWVANLWRVFLEFYPLFHLIAYPLLVAYHSLIPTLVGLAITLTLTLLTVAELVLLPLRLLLAAAVHQDRKRARLVRQARRARRARRHQQTTSLLVPAPAPPRQSSDARPGTQQLPVVSSRSAPRSASPPSGPSAPRRSFPSGRRRTPRPPPKS
jgi:hypothetical protein